MPVFNITMKRRDPNSDAYEITSATVAAEGSFEALTHFKEFADVLGHDDWEFSAMECAVRDDMIMEGEEKPKRSWLCRLLCR